MSYTIQVGNGRPVTIDEVEDPETNGNNLNIANKRAERNFLLASSDDMVLPDRGLSESKTNEWKTYRQALRDMDFSDITNLNWPSKPK
tara:strand:- start:85 stop:348 length:264 start_codon:yes stop_codon:yes gene_type:complete